MFITFEGTEGSGKSTQIKTIYSTLQRAGYDVLLTREPGGTAIGDQIRALLLDHAESQHMHPRAELLLFCASRAQLVGELIRPHLERGGVVLCDRYADSTLAYQGYGHGLPVAELKQILQFATGGLYPHLTIYLDLSPARGLQRRRQGQLFGEDWNRLDDMELAFHQRVYDGYQTIIAEDEARFIRIDADQTITQVQADIKTQLIGRLPDANAKKTQ
ncbi:MAG: dTMP kinase [Anaerolineae bacterium]